MTLLQLGAFGDDNRAGIDRTLHRISCMRNRDGRIIGLTCRAGRAIPGSAIMAADLIASGRSILFMVWLLPQGPVVQEERHSSTLKQVFTELKDHEPSFLYQSWAGLALQMDEALLGCCMSACDRWCCEGLQQRRSHADMQQSCQILGMGDQVVYSKAQAERKLDIL